MTESTGAGAPMVATRAAWVLPISQPPIRDGGLLARDGRILDVGPWGAIAARAGAHERAGIPVERRDVGARAVLPGLVNAHAHLELSWMRGRLPRLPSMPDWARALIDLRRRENADEAAAAEAGIREMVACGTAAVGDIGNSAASCRPLARSPLRAVVFRELLGFNPADAEAIVARAAGQARDEEVANVRVTLSAHAPYSVAPELFRAILARIGACDSPLTGVHAAESREEVRFLEDGTGPWRDLLESVGAWNPRWQPPRCTPIDYLDRLGWLREGVVLAHAVQCSSRELARVAESGAAIVTCPRSNARLRVGAPPLDAMMASGATLAVGTDSLASADDLNVFGELAAMRRIAPQAPASRLLACATIGGARALRLDGELGSLEAGKRAAAIAVAIDPARDDVEEQMLRGVTPGEIAWVAA